MRDELCTGLWAQRYINGVFLLLWSFSRIHVMHLPLESQESLESMESQVLGHFSSVWYGSRLMELAFNQIKYGWLSHNIYATILQIYLTNRTWLQLARFVTGWSSQLLFWSSSLQSTSQCHECLSVVRKLLVGQFLPVWWCKEVLSLEIRPCHQLVEGNQWFCQQCMMFIWGKNYGVPLDNIL